MMDNSKNYYELKYVNDDYEVVVKFNALIDADSLKDYLSDFLKACSWHSEIVDGYIIADETRGSKQASCMDCSTCGKGDCHNVG